MGYTHYIYKNPKLDSDYFKWYAENVKKLLENPVVPIVWEHDEPNKPPEITNKLVRFNGVGDDGHETFFFERDQAIESWASNKEEAFMFCKTACKPYDVYVVACLLLAKLIFGNAVKISSDGTINDWQEGKKLIEEKLGLNLIFVNEEMDSVTSSQPLGNKV